MKILVTGVAGFIGSALGARLLERGDEVVGVDNLNDYYSVSLKKDRLALLQQYPNFLFRKIDVSSREDVAALFEECSFSRVANLAAQAGVRHSITNPATYIDSNIVGFANILEGCRWHGIEHLVYASSSSVYGANTNLPFSEHDNVDHPISLYAATKKANELMAHCYSHLYSLPVTGLRFFTVYGPWGRPDMALFKFTRGILSGTPIDVYNYGNMIRDFTYIDDIVDGVVKALDHPARKNGDWSGDSPDSATSLSPYRLYNIGAQTSVKLMDYIHVLEHELGEKAKINFMEIQDGDVPATKADISMIAKDLQYSPTTTIDIGIARFVDWYRGYYGE